jgi:hypothetical protein
MKGCARKTTVLPTSPFIFSHHYSLYLFLPPTLLQCYADERPPSVSCPVHITPPLSTTHPPLNFFPPHLSARLSLLQISTGLVAFSLPHSPSNVHSCLKGLVWVQAVGTSGFRSPFWPCASNAFAPYLLRRFFLLCPSSRLGAHQGLTLSLSHIHSLLPSELQRIPDGSESNAHVAELARFSDWQTASR